MLCIHVIIHPVLVCSSDPCSTTVPYVYGPSSSLSFATVDLVGRNKRTLLFFISIFVAIISRQHNDYHHDQIAWGSVQYGSSPVIGLLNINTAQLGSPEQLTVEFI